MPILCDGQKLELKDNDILINGTSFKSIVFKDFEEFHSFYKEVRGSCSERYIELCKIVSIGDQLEALMLAFEGDNSKLHLILQEIKKLRSQ